MAETSEAGFTTAELVAGYHFLKRLAKSYWSHRNLPEANRPEVNRCWDAIIEAKRLVEVEGSGLLGYEAWRVAAEPDDG